MMTSETLRHSATTIRWLAIAVLFSPSLTVMCGEQPTPPTPEAPPRAVVYAGRGTWRESITAIRRSLAWMAIEAREIDASGIRAGGLADADLLCIPGGDMYKYSLELGEQGVNAIREFVAGGGGYVGICGGAYFGATDVVWQGRTLPMRSLALFPGTSRGPVDSIAPYPECTMCEVRIVDHDHPITRAEPASEWILYCYGPSLEPAPEAPVQVLGRYAITGLPAALAVNYGRGRAFLIGTHPEIEEDDDRDGTADSEQFDDRGSDWPLVRAAARWCLGR